MYGNVAEWTESPFVEQIVDPDTGATSIEPHLTESIVKAGHWGTLPTENWTLGRFMRLPLDARKVHVGFRCARSACSRPTNAAADDESP